MRLPAAMRRRVPVWQAYLALGAVACGLYVFVPPFAGSGPLMNLHRALPACWRSWSACTGTRRRRAAPGAGSPSASCFFWFGDLYTYGYPRVFGAEVPFPSLGDAVYVAVYPALMAGLLLLIAAPQPRARPRRAHRLADHHDRPRAALVGVPDGALPPRRRARRARQVRLDRLPARRHPAARRRRPARRRLREPPRRVLPDGAEHRRAAHHRRRVRLRHAQRHLHRPGHPRRRLDRLLPALGRRRAAPVDAQARAARARPRPAPDPRPPRAAHRRVADRARDGAAARGRARRRRRARDRRLRRSCSASSWPAWPASCASRSAPSPASARSAAPAPRSSPRRAARRSTVPRCGPRGRSSASRAPPACASSRRAGSRPCSPTATAPARPRPSPPARRCSPPPAGTSPSTTASATASGCRPPARTRTSSSSRCAASCTRVLVVAGEAPPSAATRSALRALANQVSLALESAALTEEVHAAHQRGALRLARAALERPHHRARRERHGDLPEPLDRARARLQARGRRRDAVRRADRPARARPGAAPPRRRARLRGRRHRGHRVLAAPPRRRRAPVRDAPHEPARRRARPRHRAQRPRRHRAQGLRGAARPPGVPRPGHRPRQPRAVRRARPPRGRAPAPRRQRARGDLPRPRRLQDDQRQPRPRRRRRGAASRSRARLDASIRASDTAARFGGDEFAVLLEDVESAEQAGEAAERILEALRRAAPARPEGDRHRARASASPCSSPAAATEADELLRNADVAMYIAKRDGKGGYRLFEPAMHEGVLARLELRGRPAARARPPTSSSCTTSRSCG